VEDDSTQELLGGETLSEPVDSRALTVVARFDHDHPSGVVGTAGGDEVARAGAKGVDSTSGHSVQPVSAISGHLERATAAAKGLVSIAQGISDRALYHVVVVCSAPDLDPFANPRPVFLGGHFSQPSSL
jgi:hypothetical protein